MKFQQYLVFFFSVIIFVQNKKESNLHDRWSDMNGATGEPGGGEIAIHRKSSLKTIECFIARNMRIKKIKESPSGRVNVPFRGWSGPRLCPPNKAIDMIKTVFREP